MAKEPHAGHVFTVLQVCCSTSFTSREKSANSHQDTITFLGYVICQQGVEMIMIKEIQWFLVFANFY